VEAGEVGVLCAAASALLALPFAAGAAGPLAIRGDVGIFCCCDVVSLARRVVMIALAFVTCYHAAGFKLLAYECSRS
jgi:hypothetical protein